MDLSDEAFDRFVDRIYGALEKPESWRALYEELCDAIDVKSIHMLAFDKQHGTLSYSDGANLPVQGELAYMQQYRFIDPRMPLILQKPLLNWTHCHEELDEEYVAQSPFYQEFLLPGGRRYMSACKLVDNDAATVIFSTLSGIGQAPLSSKSLDFLNRLLPHISRACRIGLQNFVYSTQALVGHTLVNKLRQPVILMSSGGDIVHINEAAGQLLQSTHLVRLENGRLGLPPPHHNDFLRRCSEMEQKIKSGAAQPDTQGSQFQSMQISGNAGKEPAPETLYAFFTMLAPQNVLGTFGLRPIVMLFFYHPESAPAIDSSLLFAAFGLTPAECRIATLLAEGLSLKQIADAQGTQHETVRKQLRSIYQKTSTNRQPELIRLLLHLPHNVVQN
jgi:DNA-binding CsgD family transcriptional regulator